MSLSLQDLTTLIQSGATLDDALKKMRPPGLERMRRKAALVRSFDESLYNLLAADTSSAPDFEEFVKQPWIEPVPRTNATYGLAGGVRREYEEDWRRDPSWRSWNEKLAAFFERDPGRSALDRLYHLIPSDPEAARAHFDREYDRADRSFDLGRCHALLEILRIRNDDLTPELVTLAAETQRYYRSRALFEDEYYQTARYYERKPLTKSVLEFLDPEQPPDAPWIFELYATGGLGKSIFLRWLVSRRLVPRPWPRPCARVDLDFDVRIGAVIRRPWLLLVPVAAQLNEQLPSFTEILNTLRELEGVVNDPSNTLDEGSLVEELTDRFASALAWASTGDALVILDTLENLTLAHQDAVERILTLFENVHTKAPGFKILLSGRYRLSAHVPSFGKRFGSVTRSAEVKLFRKRESRGYLKSRGLIQHDFPVGAICDRAEGNPFKLALFAQLALERDGLTEEEVRKFPKADYAYLIERVVLRISKQPLRWVVRYGVIPRALTPDFLEQVLLQPLRNVLDGTPVDDNPAANLPELYRKGDSQDVWLAEPSAVLDPEALWKSLARYASGHGWLVVESSSKAKFHGDVTAPMRELLSGQHIYQHLTRKAIDYFEKRTREDSGRWAEWTAEALFHRIQLDPKDGIEHWERALASGPVRRDAEARLKLAMDLTGPDYVDSPVEPKRREDGTLFFDPETLAKAHYLTAEATLGMGNRTFPPEPAVWDRAHRHFLFAQRIERKRKTRVIPKWFQSYVRAAKHSLDGDDEKALSLLEKAVDESGDLRGAAWLEFAAGEIQARKGAARAETHYERAIELAGRDPDGGADKSQYRERLGNYYQQQKQYAKAVKVLEEKRGDGISDRLKAAELHCEARRFDEATRLVMEIEKEVSSAPPPLVGRLRRLQARIALDLMEPLEALRLCDQALELDTEKLAPALHLRAKILGELLDLDRAADALDQARSRYRAARDVDSARACDTTQIEIAAYYSGNLSDASILLDERKLPSSAPWLAQIERRLLRWFCLSRRGRLEEARKSFETLGNFRPGSSHIVAETIGTALALGVIDPDDELERFARILHDAEPSLRLAAVRNWRFYPRTLSVDRARIEPIVSSFPLPAPESPGSTAQGLLVAEVERVLGAPADAERRLAKLLGGLPATGRHFARFRVTKALLRLGAAQDPPELPDSFFRELASYPSIPGSYHLESSKRAIHFGRFGEAEECLDKARKLLPDSPRWSCHLEIEEAVATLAEHRGDPDEAEAARSRAGLLRRQLGFEETTEERRETPREAVLTVLVSPLEGPNLLVRTEGSGLESSKRELTADSRPVLRELAPDGEIFSYRSLKWIEANGPSASFELADLLLTDEERRFLDAHPPDDVPSGIELGLPPGPLETVPWELAKLPSAFYLYRRSWARAQDSHVVLWLQKALSELLGRPLAADGVLGPATITAIREIQKRSGREPSGLLDQETRRLVQRGIRDRGRRRGVRVLVFEPSSSARFEDHAGGSAADAYRRAGLDVHALSEVDADWARKEIAGFRPDVIHISAAIKHERSQNLVYLDAARESNFVESMQGSGSISASVLVTATSVDRLVAAVEKRTRPLVNLEILAPYGTTERLIQLFARNAFASQLFALGNACGVLATGLADPETQGLQRRILAESFARGDELGWMLSVLRHARPGRPLPDCLPFEGAALFTNTPLFCPTLPIEAG